MAPSTTDAHISPYSILEAETIVSFLRPTELVVKVRFVGDMVAHTPVHRINSISGY